MEVKLSSGFAICNGCQKLQETDIPLNIAAASTVYDRIDTVVLRLDDNENVRECEFYVLTGTPASVPVRPALTRSDSVWEIGLADILVKANSTQISNTNITDTRYETARCGIISSISEFDTTTLSQQLNAFYNETVADNQNWEENYRQEREAFADQEEQNFNAWSEGQKNIILAWYETIKGKLSGDVGVELANQIYDIQNTRMIQTYISPAYVGGGYTWSDYTLGKLTINKMLLASIMESADITNAYNNGVAPVQQAGILTQYTGQKANGYAVYVTNTGELYINAAESVFGAWSGWKKVEPDEATDAEVDAAFKEAWK